MTDRERRSLHVEFLKVATRQDLATFIELYMNTDGTRSRQWGYQDRIVQHNRLIAKRNETWQLAAAQFENIKHAVIMAYGHLLELDPEFLGEGLEREWCFIDPEVGPLALEDWVGSLDKLIQQLRDPQPVIIDLTQQDECAER